MKKILLSAIAALSLTGCVNVMYHIPPSHSADVYSPTCFVAENCVGNWWNKEYLKRYPIESAWIRLTWLVWVIDLPCEAVADTLWLPYDLYRKNVHEKSKANKKNKSEQFGTNATIERNATYKLNAQEYSIDVD